QEGLCRGRGSGDRPVAPAGPRGLSHTQAVARLSGDHTVRIDNNCADRNGAGDVGGPRLTEGGMPVLGKSPPSLINDYKMPPRTARALRAASSLSLNHPVAQGPKPHAVQLRRGIVKQVSPGVHLCFLQHPPCRLCYYGSLYAHAAPATGREEK